MFINETSPASAKHKILPLRRQAEIRNGWLVKRLETLLPKLMEETGLDCWLIIGREFSEDPLMKTLFVYPEASTGRMGILAFFRKSDGSVKRFSLYTPGGRFSAAYEGCWDKDYGDQWACLKRLLETHSPQKIGINTSANFGLADGLSAHYDHKLRETLGPDLSQRLVSAEALAVRWLETRLPEELVAYEGIAFLMQSIIRAVFSSSFIHPGITHTTDVEWMLMDQIAAMGLTPNFPADINVQRKGSPEPRLANVIIQPGDVVRCDVGLEYLGLNTDYQRLAYVMHPGEAAVPSGIREAFHTGNRFQDIVCANMVEGRTGNEIFFGALADAKAADIRAVLYSHPIGAHVHGAGPIIGLMDQQRAIPGLGEQRLHNNTCFSLEMNITQYLPEWQQDITMCHEENMAFVDGKTYFLNGRAEELYIIR